MYCGREKRYFPDEEFVETKQGTVHRTLTGSHNIWGTEVQLGEGAEARAISGSIIPPATKDSELRLENLARLTGLADIGLKGKF